LIPSYEAAMQDGAKPRGPCHQGPHQLPFQILPLIEAEPLEQLRPRFGAKAPDQRADQRER